jgi:hypothetical protein
VGAYLLALADGAGADEDADGELADLLGLLDAAAGQGETLPLCRAQAGALWWRQGGTRPLVDAATLRLMAARE